MRIQCLTATLNGVKFLTPNDRNVTTVLDQNCKATIVWDPSVLFTYLFVLNHKLHFTFHFTANFWRVSYDIHKRAYIYCNNCKAKARAYDLHSPGQNHFVIQLVAKNRPELRRINMIKRHLFNPLRNSCCNNPQHVTVIIVIASSMSQNQLCTLQTALNIVSQDRRAINLYTWAICTQTVRQGTVSIESETCSHRFCINTGLSNLQKVLHKI